MDLPSERAVLGSILLDREAIIALLPWLKAGHFYLEKHGWVFAAAEACYRRREPPDLTTVAAELRRQEQLDLIGGLSFLGELIAEVPTAVHVEYYGRAVERAAAGRALISAGGRIVALGYDDGRPVETRLAEAAQLLYDLSAGRQLGTDFVPLQDAASQYLEAVSSREDGGGGLLGLSTTYPEIDRITEGLKLGELIVLAARPGVGKTALALSLAYRLARQGYSVGFFSLEMDRELLVQRLLSQEVGMESAPIRRAVQRGDGRVIDALGRIAGLPIYLDDTGEQTLLSLRDRAVRLAARAPIDLWVVDYLQLVKGADERADEVRTISQISQGLAAMARTLRTPILALSQLSRAVEGRASKVPQLSDLRGSGSIEQDASQVWFIYRDELYDPESDQRGIAELHIAKHRNGDTGVAALRFEKATTRFTSLERYRAPEGY